MRGYIKYVKAQRDVYMSPTNELCPAYTVDDEVNGVRVRVCIWQYPKHRDGDQWFVEFWKTGQSVGRYWGTIPQIQYWLHSQGVSVSTENHYDREFERIAF